VKNIFARTSVWKKVFSIFALFLTVSGVSENKENRLSRKQHIING
jgi:hypothetical protein